MFDVSVIIVNYNTKDITHNCIDSIVDQTSGVNYEIILVDNASTDGSKEFFSLDNRVKYVYCEKNGGFGYGNNRGIEVATGKYLFLLNSDTLLVNNAIKEFFDYAERHNNKRVYGCYLIGEDDEYTCSYFYFPAFTIKSFFKRLFHLSNNLPVDYNDKEVEAVSGADMFFPKDAIGKAGTFDESIFLYGEEGELQYRMRKYGYNGFIINSPKIKHLEGKSSTPSIWKDTIKIKSHFIILKKHMFYPTYLLARVYYAINLGIRKCSFIRNKDGRRYLKTLFSKV